MDEDNKYLNLKRYEEMRDCKKKGCINKFRILKSNRLRKYCTICSKGHSIIFEKSNPQTDKEKLLISRLIHFKIICNDKNGYGIRLKRATSYFGKNSTRFTKKEVINKLKHLQNKIQEDIDRLNKE